MTDFVKAAAFAAKTSLAAKGIKVQHGIVLVDATIKLCTV